jgi:hypothetical protein
MLTDDQILEIARTNILRFGGDLRLVGPVKLTDPPGHFYKVQRNLSDRSTNLVSPFVVLSDDGRVIPISAGDVMPGVIVKLWGWEAMRKDQVLQRAVIDPDFNIPRHVEVWSAIIKEVVTGKEAPKAG